MEFVPDSPEKRDWQADQLRRIAGLALTSEFPAIADEFAVIDPETKLIPASTGDQYERLADRLFYEFLDRAMSSGDDELISLADNNAPSFGIDVLCTLLSYAPYAYTTFVWESGGHMDMSEFETAMRAGSRAVALFATTDRRRAATLETDFGLINRKVPTHERNPFKFIRMPSGQVRFVPSPLSRDKSLLEVTARESNGELGPREAHRRCPAYWEVIDSLWQRAVSIALEGPSLFQRDFALAQKGRVAHPRSPSRIN